MEVHALWIGAALTLSAYMDNASKLGDSIEDFKLAGQSRLTATNLPSPFEDGILFSREIAAASGAESIHGMKGYRDEFRILG